MNPLNQMTAINMGPFMPPAPPWVPALPPSQPPTSSFWNRTNVLSRLQELHRTLGLARAIEKELEMLIMMKSRKNSIDDAEELSTGTSIQELSCVLEENKIDLPAHESLLLEAANSLMSKLRAQLEPFGILADQSSPWQEKSAALRLANNIQKYKRNKLWRKRKRKRNAEMRAKEHEQLEQANLEADEWRAREIAKDIAKCKVEEMKKIAKVKAKEEKKRLESELELVLIVEKLQELRSIRIQKMKKQGHFMPEEDDKFLERVQAAVEEEERQTSVAADTEAAKDAIATALESRNIIQDQQPGLEIPSSNTVEVSETQEYIADAKIKTTDKEEYEKKVIEDPGRMQDSISNLPVEFYHYYYGSNNDIGTLIEVRRTWDAYLRAGGSRIPGHWVQPPPPADEVWASYLARPK